MLDENSKTAQRLQCQKLWQQSNRLSSAQQHDGALHMPNNISLLPRPQEQSPSKPRHRAEPEYSLQCIHQPRVLVTAAKARPQRLLHEHINVMWTRAYQCNVRNNILFLGKKQNTYLDRINILRLLSTFVICSLPISIWYLTLFIQLPAARENHFNCLSHIIID
jgi:hypothetical protein